MTIESSRHVASLGLVREHTEKSQDNKSREHFTLKAKKKKFMDSFHPRAGNAENSFKEALDKLMDDRSRADYAF